MPGNGPSRRGARARSTIVLLAALLVLAACGSSGSKGAASTTISNGSAIEGTLTVLAAASLTDAFTDVAAAFEAAHPGVHVELSFDGSSALATQILGGAPADVFAAADRSNLDKVVDGGAAAGEAVVFATNALQIVVEQGNPLGVTGLGDLASGLRLALCAPEVPCGRYAAEAFERAGLAVPAASAEENVKGVLTKVALGEADAGIVYVTDVRASADVTGVDLPAEHQVPASYPAVALAEAPNPAAAAAFLGYLTEPAAAAILGSYGFGEP